MTNEEAKHRLLEIERCTPIHTREDVRDFEALEVAIKALSQEPKTGHWIPTYGNVKCSVCGSVKDSREVGKATHYCDFCGVKMFEPQESEDKG